MNIGLNTFGIAQLLHYDFYGSLRKLHEFGYTAIEPCIFFDRDTPALKRALSHANLRLWKFDGGMWNSSTNAEKRIRQVHTAGFQVVSVQSSSDVGAFLSEQLDDAISLLQKTHVHYLVISPMKKTYEEAKKLIPLMNKAAEILRQKDIVLLPQGRRRYIPPLRDRHRRQKSAQASNGNQCKRHRALLYAKWRHTLYFRPPQPHCAMLDGACVESTQMV